MFEFTFLKIFIYFMEQALQRKQKQDIKFGVYVVSNHISESSDIRESIKKSDKWKLCKKNL